MARTLSEVATTAAFAQETGEIFLLILEIDHDDLGSPIRVVNNTEDIVSNGDTYTAYPFEVALPADIEDRPPEVVLRIDNVDRMLTAAIMDITSPPTVALSVILADTPNTIEAGPFNFELHSVPFDEFQIEGVLTFESVLDEPSGISMEPTKFPGVFGGYVGTWPTEGGREDEIRRGIGGRWPHRPTTPEEKK